jgi:delta14-sterol reductase/lamin-B receptor
MSVILFSPQLYSEFQARYLVDYDPGFSWWSLVLISVVHFIGLYIFRPANSEKDNFRRDPDGESVRHLTFLQTKRGTKLITSGWWGAARKINYTGDWIVTFAWCLLCGFDSPIPYFQAIYFLVLLVHRAVRDDMMCAEKYGDDWIEYKKRVPYMFIPNVI